MSDQGTRGRAPGQASIPHSDEELQLLTDADAWARAGDELRRVDPGRYLAMLKIVEGICAVHRDPMGADVADGSFVIPDGNSGDLD